MKHGVEPPRTHQLTRLFDALAREGPTPEVSIAALDSLTPFAIDDKYPRLRVTQISRTEAAEFLPVALAVADWLAVQVGVRQADEDAGPGQ